MDAPNDLAGVVIYDAVPMGSIIPDAMDRLEELETNGTADPSDDDPNDYIPVYEIGAPLNFLNVFSDVNDQLTEARPGQFTGVVLEGGVHMDPMQGGNPLIQVAAYAIAGFPQPQNPLAVRELSAGWINDMFDEKIDPATGARQADCAGQYGRRRRLVHHHHIPRRRRGGADRHAEGHGSHLTARHQPDRLRLRDSGRRTQRAADHLRAVHRGHMLAQLTTA